MTITAILTIGKLDLNDEISFRDDTFSQIQKKTKLNIRRNLEKLNSSTPKTRGNIGIRIKSIKIKNAKYITQKAIITKNKRASLIVENSSPVNAEYRRKCVKQGIEFTEAIIHQSAHNELYKRIIPKKDERVNYLFHQ